MPTKPTNIKPFSKVSQSLSRRDLAIGQPQNPKGLSRILLNRAGSGFTEFESGFGPLDVGSCGTLRSPGALGINKQLIIMAQYHTHPFSFRIKG